MKIIFFLLLSFSAMAQELWEVQAIRKWPNSKQVNSTHGLIEDWKLGDDTARYFNPNGNLRARTFIYDPSLPKPWEKEEPETPATVYSSYADAIGSSVTMGGTWYRAYKAVGTNSGTTIYNQGWTDLFENDNVSYTHTVNDFLSYTFTGDSIHVIGEKRNNHGVMNVTITKSGVTTAVRNVDIDTYANTTANQPVLLYSSRHLGHGTYTVKVTFKTFLTGQTPERNSIVVDGFRIFSSQPITDVTPIPNDPIPTDPAPSPVDIINVSPSQNVKQIIEAAVNKTINFTAGNYSLPYINVPTSVNIDGVPGQVNITATQTSSNDQGAVFGFRGGGLGNQFIRNLNINGNNLASGAIFNDRDNVTVENVKASNCKFYGIWTTDNVGFKWINNTLVNNSWSSTQWCSGELVLGGQLSNFDISGGLLQSTDSKRGYAVKILWNNPAYNRLTNGKIHGIRVDMQHYSAWGNGMSRNIGIEFADVDIYETVEIYDCVLENQTSFALGKENPGTLIVRNNVMRGEGDTYGIETICNNLVFKDCQVYETAMIIANFRSNKKVKNILIDNITFHQPNGGALSYGALVYIGEMGAENVVARNCNIDQLSGMPMVRFRSNNSTYQGPGTSNGVTIEANNTIF